MRPEFWSRSAEQLVLWERWFAWEQADPLRTTPQILDGRIRFAYGKALTVMRFVPEVVHGFASFLAEGIPHRTESSIVLGGHHDEAIATMCQYRQLLPNEYPIDYDLV